MDFGTLKPFDLLRPRARSNLRFLLLILGLNLVRVGIESEMLEGLSGVLRTLKKDGVSISGRSERQLIDN